jgi:hypothetical protein
LETPQTRENDFPVQSGVVGVRDAKGSGTVGVCVAVIKNRNVTATKAWTSFWVTTDSLVLLLGLQRKSPRRDVCADSSA